MKTLFVFLAVYFFADSAVSFFICFLYLMPNLLFSKRIRIFDNKNWGNCPGDFPISIHMNSSTDSTNKLNFSGYITVIEDIRGSIDFVMESSKCSLDLKICEKGSTRNVKEMCKKFSDTNAIYSFLFDAVKPRVSCPIKAGNYSVPAGTVDLSLFAMLPVDGFIWVVSYKLVATEKGSKIKKVVLCMRSETKITRVYRKNWGNGFK